MDRLLSCEFDIDTGNVKLSYADGSMVSIDCTEVKNMVAMRINARSELAWLVYNATLYYAEWVDCGDLKGYVNRVFSPHSGIKGNL